MSRRILFVHASPAAIGPVKSYYAQCAPSAELVNILDDGIMKLFGAAKYDAAQQRLIDFIESGRTLYGSEAAVITCSAVPPANMQAIRESSHIPVVKIDDPMAEASVLAGNRIGVLYTFAPTLKPTTELLEYTAARLGRSPLLRPMLVEGAYEALLAGDADEHDQRICRSAAALTPQCDVLMLAQVSMAHLAEKLTEETGKPVLSSLSASLDALRELMGEI